jgi:hypothetical protein
MSVALHFLVDEDFDNDIVRGLLRSLPTSARGMGRAGALRAVIVDRRQISSTAALIPNAMLL